MIYGGAKYLGRGLLLTANTISPPQDSEVPSYNHYHSILGFEALIILVGICLRCVFLAKLQTTRVPVVSLALAPSTVPDPWEVLNK